MTISYQLKRVQDVIRSLPMLVKLTMHEHWKRKKLEHYQSKQLLSLIRYATRYSPFYHDLYKGIRIDHAMVPGNLPVIDKAIMMDNFDRFVTDPRLKLTELQTHIRQLSGDEYYLGEYRVLTTSGSSGLKGVFVFNRKEWSTILAGYNRCALRTDISPSFPNRLKEITIFADNPVHASHRMKVSGQTHLINSKLLSATSSIESHVNTMNEFQPDVLSSYPSIISLLAIEQIEGRLNIHPLMIGIGGETMTKEMALNTQKAWGLTPFDVYGSTEGGAFNMDCPYHRGIHIAEDLTIMEVVDEKNQPVPDGSPGYKVLITNLFNYTQPLIRYEVSDMLTLSKECCPCGRPFKLIANVDGRNDDIIYLANTRGQDIPVHPIHFASALGIIKEIKEYCVVQEDEGMTISVVLRNEASRDGVADEIKANLENSFKKLDVKYSDIRIQFIDKITRDPNAMGKLKLVQSNVKKSSRLTVMNAASRPVDSVH